MKILDIITESHHKCPHCGGPLVSESELMEKKDACYYKIKSSAKVWPSAYASGRLVQCRKKGAANYGNKSESVAEGKSAIFSPGTEVTVPHKGKMVPGKIVRYDSGKGIESPAYIVDISEYESLIVPVSRVKQDMDEGYAMEDEQIDGMAQGEIREIIKNAVHIKNQLDSGVSLDGWMYSFVTVSNDKLNSVAEQIGNPNISDEEDLDEGENWSKYNHKRVGGMSKKSVSSYRRSHPGSKIQTAVTTKPSKLKKGSKAAKRRASFCARMRGMKKHRTGAKTAHDPNSNINKSLRRWHCESIEELHELVMLAEQYIRNNKK